VMGEGRTGKKGRGKSIVIVFGRAWESRIRLLRRGRSLKGRRGRRRCRGCFEELLGWSRLGELGLRMRMRMMRMMARRPECVVRFEMVVLKMSAVHFDTHIETVSMGGCNRPHIQAFKAWTCPSLGCLATSSPPKTNSSNPSLPELSSIAATECEDLFNTSCSAIFFHLAVREPGPALVAMTESSCLEINN
jgi:hypothetical protein